MPDRQVEVTFIAVKHLLSKLTMHWLFLDDFLVHSRPHTPEVHCASAVGDHASFARPFVVHNGRICQS